MYAGRVAGIAEQTDQAFGFVLRVFQNQQADGFSFRWPWKGLSPRPGGREKTANGGVGAIYRDFQSESKSSSPQAAGPLAL